MENIVIAKDADTVAKRVAHDLVAAARLAASAQRRFALALSGGTTPKLLYQHLSGPEFVNEMPWHCLELFWGDERCVPPNAADSNFHMASEVMLNHVPIRAEQIHRIVGENAPEAESARYADEIRNVVERQRGGLPRFDWVLLGMGDDGHTASLFPEQELQAANELCGVASHPSTGQKRVSFTYELINAASHVAFVVTGANKANMLATIIGRVPGREKFPAARINPRAGNTTWYLDRAAGKDIAKKL
ncbi:MAG: 6-phosphogluconolactonase [Deltaproteobacteria bacterium]|nr:6-phosphogluconolactonase [Deltaproteobacteria bacterium]